MSKIFLEILDKEQRKTFDKLSLFKNQGYLAGGTALALQIKHRKSFDLDVFVKKAISSHFKGKIRQVFGEIDVYVDTGDQISFATQSGSSVTFVWYYYEPLFDLLETPSIGLASVKDIAADKAHTIGRRAVWRDYVDIFCLIKEKHLTLAQIINLAKKKFRGEFNEALFLEQLVYFEDLTITPIEFLAPSHSPRQIQKFLEDEIKSYADEKVGAVIENRKQ